jgi:hypothetical protein
MGTHEIRCRTHQNRRTSFAPVTKERGGGGSLYELDTRLKLIGYTGPLTTTARSGLHDVCHITKRLETAESISLTQPEAQ